MGWSNYLLNHKLKLALEISRHIEDTDIDLNYIQDLFEYFNESEELNLEVIKYLLKKCGYSNLDEILLSYFKSNYGFSELVHEDKVPKGYLRITKN